MLKKIMWMLVCISLPTLALAKDMPRGKWWRNADIASAIKLSETEKTALDEAYVDNRRKLIELKSQLRMQRFELEVMMENEPLNEDAVMQQFQQMSLVRQELSMARFQFVLQVRRILGAERFEQLEQQFRQHRHKKGDRKGGRDRFEEPMERPGPGDGPPPAE